MDTSTLIAIGAFLAAIATPTLGFFRDRGANKNKADENKTAIDTLIDTRVKAELVRVYERIEAQDVIIADQDEKIRTLQGSERSTKHIVRRWFHYLLEWDRSGRRGAMPLPSREDMARLDLDPNEGTIPADQLATMRAAATTEGALP